MIESMRLIAVLLLLSCAGRAAGWRDLLEGGKLDAWQTVGEGVWTVTRERTLIGQRDTRKPHIKTDPDQAWLYTKQDFGNFDLHIEWWTRLNGNSGISLRDTSRARYSFGAEADRNKTPSHIGYEIQISNGYRDKFGSGSLYLFQPATAGHQIENDWNAFDIECRSDAIRVKLNGKLVMQHAGDPQRSKTGPVGLQLHDLQSLVMFRNIRIREVKK